MLTESLQDRMLDAAEVVVFRQGIANLTLEAVAAEAKMSKGGLLHYFPTKDRLIEGLVNRCAEHWRAGMLEAFEETPEGPGRMTRALLSHLDDAETWTEQCQQSSSAAFAALAQNPKLIEPMRAGVQRVSPPPGRGWPGARRGRDRAGRDGWIVVESRAGSGAG
jgi:AcrR family transcriptional regulator